MTGMAGIQKRRIRMKARATPEAGEGTFSSVVSTYNLAYDVGWGFTEQIVDGCFAASIAAHPACPIFYQHAWDLGPIGRATPVEEPGKLSMVNGQLYLGMGDLVQRVWQGMLDETLEEWSIGFWAEVLTWDADNPRLDTITQGDLAEASVCVRGANPETGTIDLASRAPVYIVGDETTRKAEVMRTRAVVEAEGAPPVRLDGPTGGTVSETSWSGSASRFSDDQYKTSCAVCRGDKPDTPKTDCSLPHHEPGGQVSRAGVHAAAGRLASSDLTEQQKTAAAAHLRSHYSKDLHEDPPDSIKADVRTRADVTGNCPSCGHPADVHNDTQAGDNTGACQAPDCDCSGPDADPDDGDGGDGLTEDQRARGWSLLAAGWPRESLRL